MIRTATWKECRKLSLKFLGNTHPLILPPPHPLSVPVWFWSVPSQVWMDHRIILNIYYFYMFFFIDQEISISKRYPPGHELEGADTTLSADTMPSPEEWGPHLWIYCILSFNLSFIAFSNTNFYTHIYRFIKRRAPQRSLPGSCIILGSCMLTICTYLFSLLRSILNFHVF